MTGRLSNDLARIKTVIESDRRNVSCEVENMMKYDLTCVLRGYFENASSPNIQITPYHGGLEVKISLVCKCVKSGGAIAVGTDALR